ncbi:hypothetical protein MYRNA_266 [Mycobacterium phage Myrna]|uniref:Uncharacterized protein n=1 Tax=Mycobacterium phage Myrna TaxID=546805 RepID=B5LJN6_9CAUD|nr:gp266 [Mycobacterium phage Myrna]ACH62233.1 hypothetical protein MYRNA_266 [Mycobacterium phage Myrna]
MGQSQVSGRLIFEADREKVKRTLSRYAKSDLHNGQYTVPELMWDDLIDELAYALGESRPKPKPQWRQPKGIPVLFGDDVFQITGRGLVVALRMDSRQPVRDVALHDLVRFHESTKTSGMNELARIVPEVDPKKVYEITGIETQGNGSNGLRGLLVKPVAREL